jgi:DNA-binding beta-propeller fold protein YncE
VQAGIQPDSIAIAPNGRVAVVANEAEAPAVGDRGGDGSLSVIDLSSFDVDRPAPFRVTTVPLPAAADVFGADTGRIDELGRLPIDNQPASLEPETVAFGADSRVAYITLQENNAVARLDVATLSVTYMPLGRVDHMADLAADGRYSADSRLTVFREPDGIAVDTEGGFFVTADEGDTRNAAGELDVRGGRTVSVFDAMTGAWLGDTGSQLEARAADAGLHADARSPLGGGEPEGLAITRERGRALVAVSLERANAVAIVEVTDPSMPQVAAIGEVGVGPEGVTFFRRGSRLLVAVANEVSGTLSILDVLF